ncbi:hypothetical protein [Actinoplanes palleronii]|nr:hypothetical protein [Actinoplanes palleronii]
MNGSVTQTLLHHGRGPIVVVRRRTGPPAAGDHTARSVLGGAGT